MCFPSGSKKENKPSKLTTPVDPLEKPKASLDKPTDIIVEEDLKKSEFDSQNTYDTHKSKSALDLKTRKRSRKNSPLNALRIPRI